MAVEADIRERIRQLIRLASRDLRFEAVYLFGSTAKGRRTEWSDIDLAVVSPDFTGDSFEDSKILFPYILQVDTAIEVHTFLPSEFASDNPFVKEIKTTGIRVH